MVYFILLIIAIIVLVALNELGYGFAAFLPLMIFVWWLDYYKIFPENSDKKE